MKKIVLALMALTFIATSTALAMTPEEAREARRLELKEIKKAQRAAREQKKNVPQGEAKGFWAKEADRSGLSSMKNPIGVLPNLNPMPFFKQQQEQYKARKEKRQ